MDFGEVLRKTWDISWRNKGLWILGILAGCSASGRGNFGSSSSSARGYNFDYDKAPDFFGDPNYWDFGRREEGVIIPIILGLFCLALIVAIVVFVLGVIGQSGLIAGFKKADDGADVSFSEALSDGLQYFWKLVGIRILFFLLGIGFVFALIMLFLIVGIGTLGIGLICLVPLICLLIPFGMAVDSYIILTMVAAVEEDLGVFEAFGRSWNTFKENLGPVVVMILILILGFGILAMLISLPFFFVLFPVLTGLILGTDASLVSGIVIGILCALAAIPLLVVIYGLISTYTTGAWTLTYRRLNGTMGAALPAA